ncbi:hypothetical protein EG68_08617 [Paragonimus skrjabini miyazakii]|uniref:Uncharacterized protein n=1 Tax=Paragonimus skrjabini miyazakii TaxID=59628 RepID=A0A8S9YPB3_9TREM|nr:hypothetical protein EG68_08617 [Paragonimus skrjabini miyazakii]
MEIFVSSHVKRFANATQDLNASLTIGDDVSTPVQRYSPIDLSEKLTNAGRSESSDLTEEVQCDLISHSTCQTNHQTDCVVTNGDMRHVVIGCHRDRMSVVVEDSDEDWFTEPNAQSPVENLDPLLVCNSVISDECLSENPHLLDDLSKQADVHLSSFHPKEFHDQNVSDTETIDEAQIVREIDIVRPMAEQWSETNYATVLRQYPSRRLLKSKHGLGVKSAVNNRLPTDDVCGQKHTSERNYSIQKVTSWVDQVSHTDSADYKHIVDGPVENCIVQAVPYRNVDLNSRTVTVNDYVNIDKQKLQEKSRDKTPIHSSTSDTRTTQPIQYVHCTKGSVPSNTWMKTMM